MELKWSRFNVEVPVEDEHGPASVVFNTLTRSLVTLRGSMMKKASIMALQGLVSHGSPEVEHLIRTGILVERERDESAYLKFVINNMKHNREGLSLIVAFSSACNFSCPYCFESEKSGTGHLSLEKWRSLLAFMQNRAEKFHAQSIGLVLFGGEPMLNYDVLLQAAREFKDFSARGIKTSCLLVTNGSLLSEGRAKELGLYLDSVQITIDGPRFLHDMRRPYSDGKGSYYDILENVMFASNAVPIGLRVNVAEPNVEIIREWLLDLVELGFHRKLQSLDFAPEFSSQREIADHGCDIKENANLLIKIAGLVTDAAKLGFRLSKRFIFGPCMASHINSLTVDDQLNVYKCGGDLFHNPCARIKDDGELEILNSRWYESVGFEPSCTGECVYSPICYGGCRWLAGGFTKVRCNREVIDKTIHPLIAAYAMTKRNTKQNDSQS